MWLPLVSIIIPVFNGSNYLRKAIDSALAQNYGNFEIIVVNDGSTDGGATENIALSYGAQIHYFQKENGGVASALNDAISVMNGSYFSWLSHDDEYLPTKIETQVKFLRKIDRQDAIIYSGFEVIDSKSVKTGTMLMPSIDPQDFRYWLASASLLHGCTLLVPLERFARSGGFDLRLKTTQDYDLWFRMAATSSFIGMPDVLIRSRNHAEQGTRILGDTVSAECDELHAGFLRHLLEDGDLDRDGPVARVRKIAALAASFRRRGFRDAYRNASLAALRESGRLGLLVRMRTKATVLGWGDTAQQWVKKIGRFGRDPIGILLRKLSGNR
jgi:glycosyltransferase involved in cell wall biosynthesis